MRRDGAQPAHLAPRATSWLLHRAEEALSHVDGAVDGLESICRRIIEAHGGRLWASGDLGPGASFSFTLPPNRETPTVAQD